VEQSCIFHPLGNRIAVVLQDYQQITGKAAAAAILSLFEYWANEAIENGSDQSNPDRIEVGARTVKEFEAALLGLCSEKSIRTHLKSLEALGFIARTQRPTLDRTQVYSFCVGAVQNALRHTAQDEGAINALV